MTRIFIGRPFLFSNTTTRTSASGPSSVGQPGPQSTTSVSTTASATTATKLSSLVRSRATLVTDCVEAALEIVDLCQLLRDERGLARASFTEFSSCRAALLVIMAQSLTKHTDRLRAALQQGMGLIKTMSMGFGSARSAVGVIEALERAIRRLDASWSDSALAAQQRESAGQAQSGYDRFKAWELLWKSGPVSPVTSTFRTTAAGTSAATPTASPASTFHQDRFNYDSSRRFTPISSGTALQDDQVGPGVDVDMFVTPMPASSLAQEPEAVAEADREAEAEAGQEAEQGAVADGTDQQYHLAPADQIDNDNEMDSKRYSAADYQAAHEPGIGIGVEVGVGFGGDGLSMPTPLHLDHFTSNFSQELDEFTAITCYDNEFQLAQAGVSDLNWFQPMCE